MTSTVSTSRILAAGSSLFGLITVMTEPAPSAAGILVALVCILLWAVFSSVPTAKKPTIRPATRKLPAPAETVEPPPTRSSPPLPARSTQPAPAQPAEQPRPAPKATPMRSSNVLSVPTHRQRITDRRTSG